MVDDDFKDALHKGRGGDGDRSDDAAADPEQPDRNIPSEPSGHGGVCPYCGAKMKDYSHNFNSTLVRCLVSVYELFGTEEVFNYRDVKFAAFHKTDGSCKDNFQKLQYWGVVVKHRRGFWQVTELGKKFCEGEASIQRTVVTYRAHVKEFKGDMIFIDEAGGPSGTAETFAAEARAHRE